MPQRMQFRRMLPILQTALAMLFGGWGLWARNEILSHSWMGWSSTARFHVWPWPFKFAAVLNMPAFLAGSLLSWPIGNRWPGLPEFAQLSLSLLFVALLWYWIGSWLDRRQGVTDRAGDALKRPWMLLIVFGLVCAVGASLPPSSFAGYTTYLPYGVVVWMIVGLGMAALAIKRKFGSRPA